LNNVELEDYDDNYYIHGDDFLDYNANSFDNQNDDDIYHPARDTIASGDHIDKECGMYCGGLSQNHI